MAGDVDTKVVGKSFKVEINGQFLPVRLYNGGEKTSNRISELTIQAYMTPTQKVLTDAAHKVANLGQNERFTITITELAKDKSVVKTSVYGNCLLTSLDFPPLNAHSGELLCETATFQPETLTVQ